MFAHQQIPMTCQSTQSIRCPAPAKINLSLAVLGRRSDGFHDIESWVIPIDWQDSCLLDSADGLTLSIAGQAGDIPTDGENLIWRAAEELASAAGRRANVAIRLEKSIPVGAGLGGGSSDAAATLKGLNRLWDLNWPLDRLLPIAARIGSDVPFFLQSKPAIIRGRGEIIDRLDSPVGQSRPGWVVLIVPRFRLSTAEVYAAWSDLQQASALPMMRPWLEPAGDSLSLMCRLYNHLETAAFVVEPRLRRLHEIVDGLEGRPVRMTGSGSALFALFDHPGEAAAWKSRVINCLDPDTEVNAEIHTVAIQ